MKQVFMATSFTLILDLYYIKIRLLKNGEQVIIKTPDLGTKIIVTFSEIKDLNNGLNINLIQNICPTDKGIYF